MNTRIKDRLAFIDLFAGIGGLRLPFDELGCEFVFGSDWDVDAQNVYEANFGYRLHGDITRISEDDIPDHDILLAGFPCQAFSIMGEMKGFEDTRGTLFFDILRILHAKQPKVVLLENVKQLVGHEKGQTLKIILEQLTFLGYHVHWKVLNALNFGLPHKRERIFVVGFKENYNFKFPAGIREYKPLVDILEKDVPAQYFASEHIRSRRFASHISKYYPSIWHENKSGHISSYPFSCALRANASYNYLLVNGERRLTPREMLRLLGFPDSFRITVGYSQMRKLAGNSVCVSVVRAVANEIMRCLNGHKYFGEYYPVSYGEQLALQVNI